MNEGKQGQEMNSGKPERVCWILLTINIYFISSGYITFFQTEFQFSSPLLSKEIIIMLAGPYLKTSLILCGTFLLSLWLFFLKKFRAVIVVQIISGVAYYVLPYLFRE